MSSLTNQTKIPILVGPTGVGKSELAYRFALQEDFEIISADAFQVYKGMEVGTAQPSQDIQAKVTHHLIGVRAPQESWNAVQFATEAARILRSDKNKKYLLVGGAGFYLRALVDGPPEGGAPSPEVRAMVAEKIALLNAEEAMAWLATLDEEAAVRLDSNDLRRITRAIEKTFEAPVVKVDYEPLGEDKVIFIGVERSRESLDKILRKRTQVMWAQGLLDETQHLMSLNLPKEHPALVAIGYAEAAAFLEKTMGEEEALEKIFRRTRQYAKRQWTWFKHQHEVEWLNLDDFSTMDLAVKKLSEKLS